MMNKKMMWAACLVALVMTAGCGKDTPPEPKPQPKPDTTNTVVPGGKGQYLLETTVKNPDGMSGSSY